MNPLTNMRNVLKLSEQELYTNNTTSWHDQYRDSAWVFIGGLPYDLSEGDIICIFSQYGEVVNINLIRDKDSGKSKGFCFLCYEDQRSTVLAVDNFNGIKILNRIIRVDHVSKYKVPKEGKKTDEETKKLYQEGCAPKAKPINIPLIPKKKNDDLRETLADHIVADIKLPARLPIYSVKKEPEETEVRVKDEKEEEEKKEKKKKKHVSSDDSDSESDHKKSKKKKKRRSSEESDESEYTKRKKLYKSKEEKARKSLFKKNKKKYYKEKLAEFEEDDETNKEKKRESSLDRHYVPQRYK